MIAYDVTCPICGYINKDIYLEETDGWMECEKCGQITQNLKIRSKKAVRLPVFSIENFSLDVFTSGKCGRKNLLQIKANRR